MLRNGCTTWSTANLRCPNLGCRFCWKPPPPWRRSARSGAQNTTRTGRKTTMSETIASSPEPPPPTAGSLVELGRKPGQVFTREELLEKVWGYKHASDTRLVNVHVQRLRSKIETDPENPKIVLTVRGVGYKVSTEL